MKVKYVNKKKDKKDKKDKKGKKRKKKTNGESFSSSSDFDS